MKSPKTHCRQGTRTQAQVIERIIHDEKFAVIWRIGVNWFELRDADVRCTVSWQGTTSAAAAAAAVDGGGGGGGGDDGGGGSRLSVCDEPCVRRSTRCGRSLSPLKPVNYSRRRYDTMNRCVTVRHASVGTLITYLC